MSKILMIGDLNPASYESATLQFLSLAEGLSRHAMHVDIITRRSRNKATAIALKHKNIKLHTWLGPRWSRMFQYGRVFFFLLCKRFHVIYLRYQRLPTWLLISLRILSRAQIISHHAAWQAARPSRLKLTQRLRLKRQLRNAHLSHGVHVTTEQLYNLLYDHGIDNRKLLLVENGSQTNKIYPLAHETSFKRFNLDPDYVYLGFVGQLAERQDLPTVLKALALIKEKNPYIKLIIVGNGPKLAELQNLSETLKLNQETIFFGLIPHHDLNALLNAFDVALAPFLPEHTSDAGLSPLKLRDYAAAGLPTLVAEVPGIKHEGRDMSWLCCYPPADHEALAQLILTLVEQNPKRISMGQAARDYAQHYYDWKVLGKELLTQIKRLSRKPQQSLTPQSLLEK